MLLVLSTTATLDAAQAMNQGSGSAPHPPSPTCVPREAVLFMPGPTSLVLPDVLRFHTAFIHGCGNVRGVAVFADSNPFGCGSLCRWVWVGVEVVR